ncbi:MAG: hypothetical protein JNK37_05605 [Verrucomicrobiales bacterium]|nr:hypothetical protein [Verrucomicrobiales bacterium]
MFWLRLLSLFAPVGVLSAALWLVGQARQLVYRTDSDLVIAVRQAPGPVNPLMPSTGVSREIADLIFDRLLRLDDELELRPHLADAWTYRHRATVYFDSPEAAAAAYNRVDNLKSRWTEWSLVECVHDRDLIHLVSTEPRAVWLPALRQAAWSDAPPATLSWVRLTVREAVEQSFGDFLSGALEKGPIRHIRYRDDRIADIHLAGDAAPFLKELRLYYESNRALDPVIEEKGGVSWTAELDFELTLRDDVRWHDGQPVTADDLLFTFAEITGSRSPWPLRGAFHFVERLEKAGPHTVRARCREYYAPALERWAKLPLLPAHRLAGAASGADWDAFFARPVGTGPYKFEEISVAGEITLAAHPAYFRGAPKQGRVRYRVFADPADRRLALRLGLMDVYQPDEAERRWAVSTGAARVIEDVTRYQSFVAWNLDRPLFREAAMRRALAQALDDRTVRAGAARGQAEPWDGLFFPGAWFASPPVGMPEHDPATADSALRDAGWTRSDPAGYWRDGSGRSLAFTLAYDAADALHVELAAALLGAWRQAGVEVRLEPIDWATLVSQRLATRDFDALLLGWELDFTRDQWAVWHSSEAGPGGSNFCGLRDAEIDGLLTQLRTTEDRAAVKAATEALQRRIIDLQPCLFLCGTGRAVAFRPEAVRQSRPQADGEWTDGPVSIGRAGLPAARPWWVRSVPELPFLTRP